MSTKSFAFAIPWQHVLKATWIGEYLGPTLEVNVLASLYKTRLKYPIMDPHDLHFLAGPVNTHATIDFRY